MRIASAMGLATILILTACASEADRLAARAKEAEERGDLESALQHIEMAIEADPGDGTNHRRRGEWLWEQGNLQRALEAFDRAVAAEDPSLSAHRKAVAVALELGDLDGAERRLAAARQALTDGESERDLDELEQLLTSMRAEADATANPEADATANPETAPPPSPESTLPGVAFINWTVTNENNIQEFRVHRADSPEGPFTLISTIPAQGPGQHGNQQYRFEERNLEVGRVLHYKIEYINLDDTTLEVGPVRYVVDVEESTPPLEGGQP